MRSPLVALFLSIGLLFGQAKKPAKKATVAAPVAEATGQWILGTVGVGKQKDDSIDSTGLKGLAIRIGEGHRLRLGSLSSDWRLVRQVHDGDESDVSRRLSDVDG